MVFRRVKLSPGMLVPPAIVGVLLVIIAAGLSVSSGVRGYVGGALEWAKAQKAGIIALQRYALDGDPAGFAEYERSLVVPHAVRAARLELLQPSPDRGRAIALLVEGNNHEDDAKRMAWVFRRFRTFAFFEEATGIWERSDVALDSIDTEARRLHALVARGGRALDPEVDAVLARIHAIDLGLTRRERAFSETLAEGARWMHGVLLLAIALAGIALAAVGVLMLGRLAAFEARSAELEQQRDRERLAAERTLRERDEQLRQAQKMEAVGRLAGGVAHDFNNLLTVIRGNLDLALSAVDPASPVAEELADAVRAADRAGDLTSQLLMFSRRQVPVTDALQLNAVVVETRSMLERLIGESIRLETQLASDAAPVMGDAGQLAQVVVNLAVNARDAMPEGGTMVIRTRNATGAPPMGAVGTPTAAHSERWTVLEVGDNGHGIDEETRDRLFEPFFTTKEVGRGTGLGLATVYGIVTAMHGVIEVESAPGAGATFRLWFPSAAAGAEAADAEPTGDATEDAADQRERGVVLVVEDEYMVRNLVCRVLESAGYRVTEARNGREALDLLAGDAPPPDLIVSDVVMPEMGGREFAHQLRRRGLLVPILFISGYSADSSPLAGTRAPAAMLVQKPFTAQELRSRVARVLAEPSLG